ncbi:MAG TPA: FAD-dependent monooxygenase [Pyrinomonadaceae bacterium]|nr:FAD-dependent monooxygenase [Pyrinomonadaceae bacterium]
MATTDVLIIGAGPTGLALACQLIRYGIDFRIVDRKEDTTPYSKAIGVQARTLEIYEQIGLADKLIALGQVVEKVRMFAGGKVRGEAEFKSLGEGLSPYPYVLIVEQGAHERLLYDHIKAAGKDVDWQTELVDFIQDEAGVHAQVRASDGAEKTIDAKYLVACDGAKSLVRHKLGLEFGGSTFDRMFYVADVKLDWEYGHDALQVFLMKDQLLAFFPMLGDRRYRIVGTFPEEFTKDEGDVLYNEIEEQIKKDAALKLDITDTNWFSTYRVHTRHVDRFSVGRVFLAGDSAHIHSPAGAQGMNTGIQDGYNLAWKLAWVLSGSASGELLSTYNEERLPNAEQLTKTTDRFFAMAAGPEAVMAFTRLYIFPYIAQFLFSLDAVKRFVFPRISQIQINYENYTLSRQIGSFDVKAGDRMPWLEIDGRSIYDDLREPQFHLVIFNDGKTEIPALPDELMQAWEGKIDSHFYALFPHVSEVFGTDRSFFMILRPDNYIGMISNDFSPERVREYLNLVTQ